MVGVDTDETDDVAGGEKGGGAEEEEGAQPDSIDEYLEKTLDEDAVNAAAAAAAAADVKRRLEFESPATAGRAAETSAGGDAATKG